MSHIIIDRRLNGKNKSSSNRKKLLDRVKARTQQVVKKAIKDGKISDIVSDRSEKVNIPEKDINEPFFHHGKGGINKRVLPGNKDFIPGDRIPRPEGGGGGGGRKGSPDGEGEDDFAFTITKDEFLEIFFEDLALPNLMDKELAKVDEYKLQKAGYVTDGDPSQLDLLKSMVSATGRRLALGGGKKRKLKKLKEELNELRTYVDEHPDEDCTVQLARIEEIVKEIAKIRVKLENIPFIDDIDLRYHNSIKVPVPTTQAVMFCIMDVSGSMGEWEKEMAKRFFMLLYLFLHRNYEKVDVVFIRHHSSAKEVDEEEFFYSRESGGTQVSTSLELAKKIINERYSPSAWNIYVCQASDGDNFPHDNDETERLLTQAILPAAQYYAYVETSKYESSDLWPVYERVRATNKNFDMVKIKSAEDIYPVFRRLFSNK